MTTPGCSAWRHAWICLLLAIGAGAARAAPIELMVGGIEKQIYLPALLADRLGYFREQGLDVHLSTDRSGVNAEDELLAGGVQGVVGFYDHAIDLQAKGKFVESVVQFSQAPGEMLVVAARRADAVTSLAQLRARSVGVTGIGSSTHLLVQYLALANGVKSGELTITAAGSGADFAAALHEGRIDAGMTTEPTASRLVKSGEARVLADLRTPKDAMGALGGLYPAACLYMSTAWVAAHHEDVQRLVNAFVKALRFIDAHGAAEIAALLPADLLGGDRELYVATLQESKSMFVPDGVMPTAGPPNVLRVMRLASHIVAAKPIDLSRTYTTEFARAAR
jgi:NitT/TauT family transport system substrate-binding protein